MLRAVVPCLHMVRAGIAVAAYYLLSYYCSNEQSASSSSGTLCASDQPGHLRYSSLEFDEIMRIVERLAR
jgi:hypothetical protein